MRPFVAAGGGFLVAVLWFDLMFDVQVARLAGGDVPEPVLASVAGYYRRVTTTARPMNRLVATAMVATLALVIAEVARGEYAGWVRWVSLALVLPPILVAGAHTVPSAVRLGGRADDLARQGQLARAILRDHLFCICAIAGLLVVQLAFA